jgi:hypothetical protein
LCLDCFYVAVSFLGNLSYVHLVIVVVQGYLIIGRLELFAAAVELLLYLFLQAGLLGGLARVLLVREVGILCGDLFSAGML